MSQISNAVESMEGSELVVFLTTFDYKDSSAESVPAERPEFGTFEYGAYYDDTSNPGTFVPEPDTWAEVEYLHAAGKLDREVYYAVLEDRVGTAGESAAQVEDTPPAE